MIFLIDWDIDKKKKKKNITPSRLAMSSTQLDSFHLKGKGGGGANIFQLKK
jgi:hypothetical protein